MPEKTERGRGGTEGVGDSGEEEGAVGVGGVGDGKASAYLHRPIPNTLAWTCTKRISAGDAPFAAFHDLDTIFSRLQKLCHVIPRGSRMPVNLSARWQIAIQKWNVKGM